MLLYKLLCQVISSIPHTLHKQPWRKPIGLKHFDPSSALTIGWFKDNFSGWILYDWRCTSRISLQLIDRDHCMLDVRSVGIVKKNFVGQYLSVSGRIHFLLILVDCPCSNPVLFLRLIDFVKMKEEIFV